MRGLSKKRKNKDAKPAEPAAPAARAALVPWLKWIEPGSLVALYFYLLNTTWMRWPDPIIDFPRAPYTAWRLVSGDRLYDQIASWYGPLPDLLGALAFRLFGVRMHTIIWLNILVTFCTLWLIRGVFGRLGGRISGWLCSVVFLVVFAVAQYVGIGNYNFITPYAAQATYGLTGCLLTLYALLRHSKTPLRRWLVTAGAGLGIAYLCKPEPVLAGGGALALYWVTRWISAGRTTGDAGGWSRASQQAARELGEMFVGFAGVWAAGFVVLAGQGGVAYGFRAVNWVAYTVLSPSFRQTGTASFFNAATLGFDKPMENFMAQLKASAMLVLFCLPFLAAGWMQTRAPWRMPGRVVAVVAALLIGYNVSVGAWLDIGQAIVFPVLLLAAAAIIWALVGAWRQRTDTARALGLAVVGAAAALMLARMLLNGRIFHYGFFMALLAALFLVHVLVVEVPRLFAGSSTCNCWLCGSFVAVVLAATFQLGRISANTFAVKTFAVAGGVDQFFTFDPQRTPAGINGAILEIAYENLRKAVPDARTLIAFPESAAFNYNLRIPDPIASTEFHPGGLNFLGREKTLAELQAHPPDAVIIYSRDLTEYDPDSGPGNPGFFGKNPNTGLAIWEWIKQNYRLVVAAPNASPLSPTGHLLDILVRKDLPAQAPPSP